MDVPHSVEVDYRRRVVSVDTAELDTVSEYGMGESMSVPFRTVVAEIFSVLD